MGLTLSEAAPATERDLILRAQAGDSTAFGELVQRHMRRAYFGALGLVGRHEDALDLSQEAFVRAYRARRTIDAERWVVTRVGREEAVRSLSFFTAKSRNTSNGGSKAASPPSRDVKKLNR